MCLVYFYHVLIMLDKELCVWGHGHPFSLILFLNFLGILHLWPGTGAVQRLVGVLFMSVAFILDVLFHFLLPILL